MLAVERGEHFRLTLEACETNSVGRERGREDLHGHVTLQRRIRRAINLPHAAHAERRDDFVRSEASAGNEGHGTTPDEPGTLIVVECDLSPNYQMQIGELSSDRG
jgi:hypothetical protein